MRCQHGRGERLARIAVLRHPVGEGSRNGRSGARTQPRTQGRYLTRRSRFPPCFARHHGLQEPSLPAGIAAGCQERSVFEPGAQMTTRRGRMKSASLVLWKTTGAGFALRPTLFRERWSDGLFSQTTPRHSAARAGTATVSAQGLHPAVTKADRSLPIYEQAYADRHHTRGRNPRCGHGW